jgi:hypothetical protein
MAKLARIPKVQELRALARFREGLLKQGLTTRSARTLGRRHSRAVRSAPVNFVR